MAVLFKRDLLNELETWKSSSERKPLILRGARQVGKTTVVKIFAGQFDHFIFMDLEKSEEKAICEEASSFQEFLDALFFFNKVPKNSGTTLIFFDEIQNSPKTVSWLRFFKEETPHLYVIAAGSLLETLLHTHISFPVGRVEYRFLYPLSFYEFLAAMGETDLLEFLNADTIPNFVHHSLSKWFHKYLLMGGMPEAIQRYVTTRDLLQLNSVYDSLINSYMDDVEKYAKNPTSRNILRHCIRSSFFEAGKRIKFQGFGQSNYRSREIGETLRTLEKSHLIKLLYPTTNTRLPLVQDLKKSPKLQLLDTGLVNYMVGLQEEIFRQPQIDKIYDGRIAEHIVGQELLTLQSSTVQPLVFWTREKKQSTAEIDFLLSLNAMAIPMEVKAGPTGKLRSLRLFMDMVDHPYAIRVYSGPLAVDHITSIKDKKFKLLNLPFYLVGVWQNQLQKILT
ncbi:MAG: ATP-binding protein [Calditrichia bacterium]